VSPSLGLSQDTRSLRHLPEAGKQAFVGFTFAAFDDQPGLLTSTW
jgi:hypothetical protein